MPSRRLSLAVSLVAMATLVFELLLTRVFDVVLTPRLGYLIIACAILAFALAGALRALRPPDPERPLQRRLFGFAVAFALSALAVLPVFNLLPFDHDKLGAEPVVQGLLFAVMYAFAALPFFFAGLFLVDVFSAHARHIARLYFWDLLGASIGCMIPLWLIAPLGPGGMLWVVSALGLAAAALLGPVRWLSGATAAVALVAALAPLGLSLEQVEFVEHKDKRWTKMGKTIGQRELLRWDPISKIEVIDLTPADRQRADGRPVFEQKHIAYDGGNQSSLIYPFDGDMAALRARVEQDKVMPIRAGFWHRGVLASHFVKRDSGQRALIIGCAGGQEVKAALLFGAVHVDVVEMVAAVLDLAVKDYAKYNGGFFLNERVHLHADEGRAFLRAHDERWDIIQIFSSDTSSSVADGTGAMSPVYLQTAEAYQEYFGHLTDNGIVQVNFQIWPRIMTTAALAWTRLGRTDFARHVLVLERDIPMDTLPTVLIKMKPWTPAELDELGRLYSLAGPGERLPVAVHDPLNLASNMIPVELLGADPPAGLLARAPWRLNPTTDDRPFFKYLWKRWEPVPANRMAFTGRTTAAILDARLRGGEVPHDVLHLVLAASAGLLAALLGLALPLASRAGRVGFAGRGPTLLYFACLGAGFILVEYVVIQVFLRFVGFPIHALATALSALLLSAGLGSLASPRLGVSPRGRHGLAFAGILILGTLFMLGHTHFLSPFASLPLAGRMAVAAALVFPLGFFMGMPMPLGIAAIADRPPGAVAWGWALNGLFTVLGMVGGVALSVGWGFTVTMGVGLAIYGVAWVAFNLLMRASSPAPLPAEALTAAAD